MENQHKHIKGYRDLKPEEIALMNCVKATAELVGELLNALAAIQAGQEYEPDPKVLTTEQERQALKRIVKDMQLAEGRPMLDMRWVSIAKTDLQRGFMALVRSIAQPTTF